MIRLFNLDLELMKNLAVYKFEHKVV